MVLGFAGVAVIFSDDLTLLGGEAVRRAALVMLVAPLVSAVASVVVKRWGSGVHPLSLAAVPMLIAGVVMGAVALLVERHRPSSSTPARWARSSTSRSSARRSRSRSTTGCSRE